MTADGVKIMLCLSYMHPATKQVNNIKFHHTYYPEFRINTGLAGYH
jgi:hypothetical protein